MTPAPRAKGQLRDGLRYVRHEPRLALPLVMAAVVGCLAYEFQVSLPYMASHGLHVGSAGFGFMTAAMGVGAVVGGLAVATRGKIGSLRADPRRARLRDHDDARRDRAQPGARAGRAGARRRRQAWRSCRMTNATLQLRAAPEMRGRVMALWFVSFQGSTPIGGPIVGAVMAALRRARRPRARRGRLLRGGGSRGLTLRSLRARGCAMPRVAAWTSRSRADVIAA